jgi:hypothetical protein
MSDNVVSFFRPKKPTGGEPPTGDPEIGSSPYLRFPHGTRFEIVQPYTMMVSLAPEERAKQGVKWSIYLKALESMLILHKVQYELLYEHDPEDRFGPKRPDSIKIHLASMLSFPPKLLE